MDFQHKIRFIFILILLCNWSNAKSNHFFPAGWTRINRAAEVFFSSYNYLFMKEKAILTIFK